MKIVVIGGNVARNEEGHLVVALMNCGPAARAGSAVA